MENEQVFTYNYSAKKNKEIEAIRNRYLPREISELDMLRKLDADVRRPANVFAYVFGIISAIIMGAGMSLIMTELSEALGSLAMPLGIILGIIGAACAAFAYPIYCLLLKKGREKAAPEIIRLTEELMKK